MKFDSEGNRIESFPTAEEYSESKKGLQTDVILPILPLEEQIGRDEHPDTDLNAWDGKMIEYDDEHV